MPSVLRAPSGGPSASVRSNAARRRHSCIGPLAAVLALLVTTVSAEAQGFRAGFAKRDITPAAPVPMWGYGQRHASLSVGTRDPLYTKAVVIEAGDQKLALVSLDLGRSPTEAMLSRIRAAIKQDSGITLSMIVGSHTHHGPVIELLDEPGKGRGKFDAAVAYAVELETKIIEAIREAAANTRAAKIGWATKQVDLNRNRHWKLEPKPVDQELGVIRIDAVDGGPIAVIVNYAAHPTLLPAGDLRFSAEWPGQMAAAVEQALSTNCLFMQGAGGDLSPKADGESREIEAFGSAVAEHVVELAEAIQTQAPARPQLQGQEERFEFPTRLPFNNFLTQVMFATSFFPELAAASMTDELRRNLLRPRLSVVLINGELALVGGSGEFFCGHSLHLKARSHGVTTMFFGYCNGHDMYFPTVEAAAVGGYGADPMVAWTSLGSGEEMMNRALIHIYTMLGRFEFRLPF